jgi:hypothetical protein
MNIDVVDSGSGTDNGHINAQRLLHPGAIFAGDVGQMVTLILNRIGTSGNIERLRLFGHAAPGEQGMGNSEHTVKPYQLIEIDGHGRLTNRDQLARLCGHFAPNAVVELHGCNIARNHRGRELMRQLSALWNVRVRGGVENQHADAGDRFEGPVVEAHPVAGHGPRVRPAR